MRIFKSDKSKGFVMGIVFTLVLSLGLGSALAAGKLANITVSIGGITLYTDGKLTILRDANGNVVEPIIYDGTTYLPIRGIANVFDKEITWDGKNWTIYLGEQPSASKIDIATVELYDAYRPSSSTGKHLLTNDEAEFNILNKLYQPFNRLEYHGEYTYILDSKYKFIEGSFVIPYDDLGDNYTGVLQFVNVNSKGVETVIDEYYLEAGDSAIDVKVNITGVNNLKIYTYDNNSSKSSYGTFYNITLSR